MTLDTIRGRGVMLATTASLALASLVAFCPITSSPNEANAADDPAVYKALFTEKCSACHNLPDPTVNQNTKERWRALVTQMARRADNKGIAITDEEQAHIVDYLGLFPPKLAPGASGPLAAKRDDVWDVEPIRSFVYTFSSLDQLSSFRLGSGEWRQPTGAAYINGGGGTGLLLHKGAALDGGFDIQVQVRIPAQTVGKVAGIAFGATDATHFNAVVVDSAKGEIRVLAANGSAPAVIATAPVGDVDQPTGWHQLRVMYRANSGRVTVWLEANKKLVAPLPDYADGSQFGLVTLSGTTAEFRNLYADIYGK